MKNEQINGNIPVLTDVVTLGTLTPMESSGNMPAVSASDGASTDNSTKQNTADVQAAQLVQQALPLIMPELEKLARKTLFELVRKLQKQGTTRD